MGWEAIERYLLEKEQIEQTEGEQNDQKVPQLAEMLRDESEVMLTETSSLDSDTDFLAEELSFSTLAPVHLTKTTENSTETPEHASSRGSSPEQAREYFDLDRNNSDPQEMSFYEDCVKNSSITSVKSEPCYSPCFTGQSDLPFNQCDNQSTFEDMSSAIFRDQMEEIQRTCQALGMLPEPIYWSPENVRQWITWQCRRFNLPVPNLDYFFFTGFQLIQLSEEDFKMYAPASGSDLYFTLFNWKTVVDQMLYTETDMKTQLQHIPVPTSFPPSPGSLSPSPTTTDDDTDRDSLPDSPEMISYIAKARDEDWLPDEPAHHRQTIQLWQFLKQLLLQPNLYNDCIKWVDRTKGVFKIENSTRVAKLWGKRKNRPAMNYDKLSRSIRQYYKKGIIKKPEITKRLVYQFCPNYL